MLSNFPGAIGKNFIFADENTRLHWSEIVFKRLQRLNIETLQVLSRSRDLNPIQHAWDVLKQRLSNHQPRPNTLPKLRAVISSI